MLTPTLVTRRPFVTVAIGLVVVGAIVAVFLVLGFRPAPFDAGGDMAIGRVENSLGDQYTMTAARLTSTWTFTRDADVVLHLGGGSVSVDGRDLAPGCYSGMVASGSVISFADATDVSFATPKTDPSCARFP